MWLNIPTNPPAKKEYVNLTLDGIPAVSDSYVVITHQVGATLLNIGMQVTTNGQNRRGVFATQAGRLNTNIWSHCVFSWDGGTNVNTFVDSVDGTNNIAVTGETGYANQIGREMTGQLGDVIIFNRVLSASEVTNLFNASRRRYGR